MILPTMTYKEMYDHLAADKQKVEIKKEYLLPKAVKAFKKRMKFLAWEIYDYTIPSTNNKYVIYFYVESRVRAEKPEVGSCCVIQDEERCYFVEWVAGGYKHTPNQPISLIRQLHIYEPHFLVRYKERFWNDKSLSLKEIVCRYMARNHNPMPIQVNEGINRNHKKYGKNGQQAFRVRDGLCFTKCYLDGEISPDGDREKDRVDAMCIIYKTYVSKSEMPDEQKLAVDKEHFIELKRFAEDVQKQAKDGIITLTLER